MAIFFIRSRMFRVVPTPRLSTRRPEMIHYGRTYAHRMRTSIAYVRRWQTHVGRIRAWIRTSPEDTYAGRTHTPETRMCIVEICSRDMRTSGNYVRAVVRRTSVEHARQRITYIKVAESRSSYARKMRTQGNTYVSRRRTSQVKIAEFLLTVVDLRICTPNLYSESILRICLVVVGTRCTQMTDESIMFAKAA